MNDITTSKAPNGFLVSPETYEQAIRFCDYLSKSNMIPKQYIAKPGDIFIAGAYGARLGMDVFGAMQNIATVNGKPCLYGDGMLSVVMNSGLCADIKETFDGNDADLTATCSVLRKGMKSYAESSFSVNDAKKAGLWGKSGPWTQYPKRMLQMRARAFALRNAFPDVLSGMGCVEEQRDIELIESPDGKQIEVETPSATSSPMPMPKAKARTKKQETPPVAETIAEPVAKPTQQSKSEQAEQANNEQTNTAKKDCYKRINEASTIEELTALWSEVKSIADDEMIDAFRVRRRTIQDESK